MAAKKRNFVEGAAILAATVVIVKIIGAIYKIPLYNLLDDRATSDFGIAYQIYSFLLNLAIAGIPVAISRLVSAALSTGRINQANKVFRISLPAFALVGLVCMLFMMLCAKPLARFMELESAAPAVRILGPAVFFCCVISVYRGYSQGHSDMVPTSISQIAEVVCKLLFGLTIAWIFVKVGKSSDAVAAAAISGSVIGLGLCIPVLIWYKRRALRTGQYENVCTDERTLPAKSTLKEILSIAIPITLSSTLMNIITIFDTKVLLRQLRVSVHLTDELVETAYAVFTRANTLFNFPSALIVPIAVSVVPAISAAIALKNHKESASVMGSSLKLTNLFAMPAGIGMCVLSYPIYNVLYWDGNDLGGKVLALLGLSSYMVCLQLVTTSLLQASGYEKISMFILPIGSIIQVGLTWLLAGIPGIGICGAAISSLICYALISLANIIVLNKKLPVRPEYKKAFLKPFLCAAVMGIVTFAVYRGAELLLGGYFLQSRFKSAVVMAVCIVIAVAIYGVLIIATGALTQEDMALIPKGEKIGKLLKLKEK